MDKKPIFGKILLAQDSVSKGSEVKFLSKTSRFVLTSEQTSRCNKLHLIAGWVDEGYYLEYKWKALPMLSRLMFQFEPDGEWITAKSFEEDVLTKYKVT